MDRPPPASRCPPRDGTRLCGGFLPVVASFFLVGAAATSLAPASARGAAPQRQPSFDEPYSIESRTALAAHHLCSGLWVVGRVTKRSPADVIAQDIAPFRAFGWQDDFDWQVDAEAGRVTVQALGLPARTAVFNGDQGCTILPRGATGVFFEPVAVPRSVPDPETTPWPTGDLGALHDLPPGVDLGALNEALAWAVAQPQNTRAVTVVHGGKIVAERTAPGWSPDTPQISWSQGKSITAALIGVLVQRGRLQVDQPAPVGAWRAPGDPRGAITIRQLLNMSSGLDFANLGLSGPQSFTRANEHMRIYFDGLNVFEHAVEQPLEVPPDARWAYRNSDPLTLGKIVRDTVEAQGRSYLTFPQQALFDRIGSRNYVLETDAWGNFIMTGYDFGSARDWARFGLLHLRDGVWEGERILPEGWSTLVSTPAPANEDRGYGGLFWLNAGGAYDSAPPDAYWAAGFMGQTTMIIPSRDTVIVRLGPSPGRFNPYMDELVGRILAALPS